MNMYVWVNTGPISTMYHDGGGLLVVATDLTAAREHALGALEGVKGLAKADWLTTDPDHTWTLDPNAEPMVLTFLDAGCC